MADEAKPVLILIAKDDGSFAWTFTEHSEKHCRAGLMAAAALKLQTMVQTMLETPQAGPVIQQANGDLLNKLRQRGS